MNERSTGDESRREDKKEMSDNLRGMYNELSKDLIWLHIQWIEYRFLFAGEQSTFDVLNNSATSFFQDLRRLMWMDILLKISKLTDTKSGKYGKYPRLVIRSFLDEIPEEDKDLSHKIKNHCKIIEKKVEFARDWRDRYIAHKELPPLDGSTPIEPLAFASRQMVDEALKSLRELFHLIEHYYLESQTAYQHPVLSNKGASKLISDLKSGIDNPDY